VGSGEWGRRGLSSGNDRFCDKVTDELVNCLNSIEPSYRGEIKDLFAAHFERFVASLPLPTSHLPGVGKEKGSWGGGEVWVP